MRLTSAAASGYGPAAFTTTRGGNTPMKRAITATLLVATLVGFTACEATDEPGTKADRTVTKDAAKDKVKTKDTTADTGSAEDAAVEPAAEPTKEAKPQKPAAPKETAEEANARETAADYLDYSAFSRKGLIEQLEFEGYSTKVATYGTDAQHANWNEQAALSAKEYLDYSSFSHSGLVEQLMFEGFTKEQAEYGVNKVGL
ncbi:MAG TPA: hypothetical protein DEQ43_10580 [Nocardioides bacterium]|nr:hypothetical protein [Nocardioides sp.]